MIDICAIASGSNGNCYYIGNKNQAILIDAGISCKQVLKRLESKKLQAENIVAIFLSHEHSDHARGIRVLSKKLGIPVYLTEKTYNTLDEKSKPALYEFIFPNSENQLGCFTIHAFSKNHDACEPVSFRVEHNNISIGVFTDIGLPCMNVIGHIQKCHALFLESNYDEEMLANGSYPWFLKNRVASDYGHLSNTQALDLVKNYANGKLKTIILSHLSGQNNSPKIALDNFNEVTTNYNVVVSSRETAMDIISIKL